MNFSKKSLKTIVAEYYGFHTNRLKAGWDTPDSPGKKRIKRRAPTCKFGLCDLNELTLNLGDVPGASPSLQRVSNFWPIPLTSFACSY